MKKMWIFLALFFLLAACQTNNQQAGNEETDEYEDQPFGYHTKSEIDRQQAQRQYNDGDQLQEENLEGYQDNLKLPDEQRDDAYTKSFYSEESQRIAEVLNQMDEVKITQAVTTEDKVMVAVMLDQTYYDEDVEPIIEEIRQHVEQIVPNKQILIQTDAIYWNQMRDLDANEGIRDDG